MTQGMHAHAFFAGKTGARHVQTKDGPKAIMLGEWLKWEEMLDEYVTGFCVWTAIAQIVDQCSPDLFCNRQALLGACLLLNISYAFFSPVKIFQLQPQKITDANTQDGYHDKHGVVTLSQRICAVNGSKQSADFIRRPCRRDMRVLIKTEFWNGLAQILSVDFCIPHPLKKGPQIAEVRVNGAVVVSSKRLAVLRYVR